MPNVPKFAMPFRFSEAGAVVVVEQDSIEEIQSCAEAVIRTQVGERDDLPGFGIPELVFQSGGPDPQGIRDAIATWEPRATATIEADDADLVDMMGRVHVTFQQTNGEA